MPRRGRPFQKGQSGNANGRPRGALSLPKIRKLLKPHAKTFVDALLELLKDSDWRAKGKALEIGMAYLWGKPPDRSLVDDDEDEEQSAGPRQTLEQLEAKYAKEGNGVAA